ncbi:MAG: aminotransferase class I/II-fold pyridoxal phosphate-dependent enzyme [Xanthomonadales bacterium]|jgi:cystathionine beta-lyase/cystathionine gamma-synthase|nr:aminotransferase class I/II-fold pyridoxal phosphate-dependent enzyme [Xanthomonadales bacterium]
MKPGIETLICHLGEDGEGCQGAVVPPMFQNSLFTFKDWDDIDAAFDERFGRSIYTRLSNPTTVLAERKIAALAGEGYHARLTASGMAAVSSAILHVLSPGDHIVAVKNIYGPSNNFINCYLRDKMNISVTFVSGEDPAEFENALTDQTRLVILESPSSVVFSLQDIAAVARLARRRGITTLIDNTWATPLYQKPLDLGIDIEVHSVSKYLGGHSDIVAGVIISSPERIRSIANNESELLGATVAPFTSWLITRSLRTLPMRLERHQENAMVVAAFLEAHPNVAKVHYPGLPSHPQHELARAQMTGFTGLMGFTLAWSELDRIKSFFNALEVFRIGVSWGGHESLVYAPAISYLKELPPERFADLGISLGDMRISVGLENAEDLIQDLSQALEVR